MKMNLTALYSDYHNKSGEQFNSVNQFVAAGLLHIIGNYFSKWSSYFVLTLCCRNNHTCNFYNDMFHKMFVEWNEWPLQIVVVNKDENIKVPGVRQYNMIFTDSYDAFKEIEINSYTADYNYNEYYLIFLQTRDHLIPGEMQKILEYCWQHYLINCVIQIQNIKGNILFYTYYPFTEKYCGKVEPILINEFNGTSLLREDLFPEKLTNLYGCPLKAALWHVPPSLYLSKDSDNITYISSGFEGTLLLVLAKKLNFTLEIKVPENDGQRGVVLRNGSLTGALKMLKNRQADFALGAFFQSIERSEVATFTTSYYQTFFAVVFISDAYLLTSMETLLYPFTRKSWYLIITMSFLSLVITAILKRIYRKKLPPKADHATLDMLLLLLGMPVLFKPRKNVSRILHTSWMMYSLLIRTTYQALLFHLIRTHITRDVPQSLEELIKNNYTMVANRQAYHVLSTLTVLKNSNLIALNSSSEIAALEYLENVPKRTAKNVVSVVLLESLQYYVESLQKAGIFKVMPDSLMNFKICMYLTKHSFLINKFDDILVYIHGSGLMEAWTNQVLDKVYCNSQHLEKDSLFGIKQLQMAFVAVFGANLVATIVFIYEVLYKKFYYNKCIRK